ncbi:hypothetical protein GCM10010862_40800 [Devosia nitrariae]|uniref:Uncharacterized protein n=1 Tax=Devosia nitrariae TaxID=2071872 RepID=A0ABQ5WB16_9HYPH|nr:hypothetical protein GCM10010862_40800 [Devosia nitrariae]
MLNQFADGRDDALDTGRVGDLAVGDRHVEIGPQQHALTPKIEIFEGFESRGHRVTVIVAKPRPL